MAAPALPELEKLLQLDIETRLEIIRVLWNSIVDGGQQPPLTDEQRRELDEALVEHERDPNDVLSLDEVDELLKR
jgi:putative addiction module component (TIGR02574 family)